MFTGLISEVGTISNINRKHNAMVYQVSCPKTLERLSQGASVAVNGICQTVTKLTPSGFITEAVSSTIAKTAIGKFRMGVKVNIEPALRAGDPLDGHILQGHVQSTGKIVSIKKNGLARVITVESATGAGSGIIAEGSVGLDGISLTVSDCRPGVFSVHVIPETWDSTIIKMKKPGDLVNVEGDILLRSRESSPVINENTLREWGY